MSDRNETIRRCLELLHQIRSHLKQHHQWSETDDELGRLIKELEEVLNKEHGRTFDPTRLVELLSRVADIIAVLLNLK
jgi:hypothetical protein